VFGLGSRAIILTGSICGSARLAADGAGVAPLDVEGSADGFPAFEVLLVACASGFLG